MLLSGLKDVSQLFGNVVVIFKNSAYVPGRAVKVLRDFLFAKEILVIWRFFFFRKSLKNLATFSCLFVQLIFLVKFTMSVVLLSQWIAKNWERIWTRLIYMCDCQNKTFEILAHQAIVLEKTYYILLHIKTETCMMFLTAYYLKLRLVLFRSFAKRIKHN